MLANFFNNLYVDGLDFTFLATAFAFNVALTFIDSVTDIVARFSFKWLDNRAVTIKEALNLNTEEGMSLAFEIDHIRLSIDRVMAVSKAVAKSAMVVCAAIAIVCMLIPYTALVTGLLMLPLPIFAVASLVYVRAIAWCKLNSKKMSLACVIRRRETDEFVKKALGSLG